MLRLIDPTKTHEFTSSEEIIEGTPLVFHVTPMNRRQAMIVGSMAKPVGGGYGFASTVTNDLLDSNVKLIVGAGPEELDEPARVKRFLDQLGTPEGVGLVAEIFKFIVELSQTTEAEAGN